MEKENTEGRFFTRIKWNPLIVLPAEGFGIELRALVLFEADSAVWARLGKHPDNNKDTAREPGSRSNSLQILELQANMCKNAVMPDGLDGVFHPATQSHYYGLSFNYTKTSL